MINFEQIDKELSNCRYASNLESLLNDLNAVKILRKDYIEDYQGYVDLDVLLEDGRIFSYGYKYGSCSGCDEWEALGLSDEEIKKVMLKEGTFFSTYESYTKWRQEVDK